MIGYKTYFSYQIRKKIKIGQNSGIGSFSHVFGNGNIKIGNNVISGPKVTFITRWHEISYDSSGNKENIMRSGDIEIHDDVFIGTNVTILPNVVIGEKSIIASGTTVYKSIPEGSFVTSAKIEINRIKNKNE